MPLHTHKPRIEDMKAGSDFRVRISVQNPDASVPSLAGGSGTVTFVPRDGTSPVSKSIALSVDPTSQPQCYVDLVPADTSGWSPGVYDAYGSIVAGGKTYKPTFWGRVLKSSA